MKAMTKITMVTASILTMGALSACQSTPAPQKDDHRGHMMGQKHERLSPEQREQKQQMRAQHKEMREQVKKACDGKAIGQAVQVKAGDQVIDGSCNIVFKADHKAMADMKHDMRKDGRMMRHEGPRMKDMTEEQRAQIKQQFEQKRTERKAQWDAIQKSCAGQTNGQAIQVKMDDKTLDGKCIVKFQPEFKVNHTMLSNSVPSSPKV